MKRSLFTGFAFFLPLPACAGENGSTQRRPQQGKGGRRRRTLGTSVHISWTFSRIMLQWRSNAFTRPSSFLLFRQLISTCVLFLTLCVRTLRGPVRYSSSFLSSVLASLQRKRKRGWFATAGAAAASTIAPDEHDKQQLYRRAAPTSFAQGLIERIALASMAAFGCAVTRCAAEVH